jgi:hypothetical protein
MENQDEQKHREERYHDLPCHTVISVEVLSEVYLSDPDMTKCQ